jgi:lysophospholipid acyltransferase (LPLAT)-like uncharacterized protein
MSEGRSDRTAVARQVATRRKPGPLKAFWRRIRAPLAESRFVASLVVALLSFAIRFVYATNRMVPGSNDPNVEFRKYSSGIAAFWHGQHILLPSLKPKGAAMIALFSRSKDAELNARVAERFGLGTVRGSGGRDQARSAEKGGAKALIALKKALDQGKAVAMIADIPHGTPREAGLGIVTLARHSGKPIVAAALATSRRKVIESSWDKTTINLPFGRKAFVVGDPIYVPSDATAEEMEAKRREVTAALNAVTERAYRLVDGA